jgi:hypothetical protein
MAAAYMMRPNSETMAKLAEYRTLDMSDEENCINLFVRHGDKGMEMELHELHDYTNVATFMHDKGYLPAPNGSVVIQDKGMKDAIPAEKKPAKEIEKDAPLWEDPWTSGNRYRYAYRHARKSLRERRRRLDSTSANPYPHPNPNRRLEGKGAEGEPSKCVFLTSDDVDVIEQSKVWAKEAGWKVIYTELFDRNKTIDKYDWETKVKMGWSGMMNGHFETEYLSMLLNLEYSVRCEAWVCTLASNSCRLIDEMRATVGGKANRYYADLSMKSCGREEDFCLHTGEILKFVD